MWSIGMNIQVELTEDDLKRLIVEHLSKVLQADVSVDSVDIKVKSKQNYKSEWETASFKATVIRSVSI